MAGFILTGKAKENLKDIARFTQKRWGKEQRNKYLQILDNCFQPLARTPAMGSHVIFYRRVTNQPIEIIHILHESMDVTPFISPNLRFRPR